MARLPDREGARDRETKAETGTECLCVSVRERVRVREREPETSIDKREVCAHVQVCRIASDPRNPQGVVGGVPLQPHESHVPFVQQFLVDHNLHGMNFVDFREVAARMPLPAVRTATAACIIVVSIELWV